MEKRTSLTIKTVREMVNRSISLLKFDIWRSFRQYLHVFKVLTSIHCMDYMYTTEQDDQISSTSHVEKLAKKTKQTKNFPSKAVKFSWVCQSLM